nr:hypothetical protein [Tanacetum cinerariifolium]
MRSLEFVFFSQTVIGELQNKKVEAAKAIRLRCQVSVAEAMEATRVCELNSLKEWNTSLEAEKVSSLEGTCFGIRDQVSGYELFKEQLEAVQDAQVKILSDRVVDLDSELMGMAVHLDEEFYPRFLTIIPGRRWIISCGFRLSTGLVAGIDHKMAERGLAEVTAHDPSVRIGALSHRLSISEAMGPLVDPLSFENLICEASASGVPATATTNIALSVLVTTANVSFIPPISMADYEVLNTKPRAKIFISPILYLNKRLWRLHRSTLRPVESAIDAVLPACKIRFYFFYHGRV